MPIYKICKSKEDENERKEDRCNHSIDNPEKKVELKSWESLGKVYTPGIHCLFPIPFGFHQEHVLEMKNDQRFQSKNLARNSSPPNLLHSICIPESAYLTGWPLVRISFELKLVIIQPILKPISFPDKFGKLVCIIDGLGKKAVNDKGEVSVQPERQLFGIKKKWGKCNRGKSINPQENSRVKTSMADNLRLTHLHGLRHPAEKSEVSLEIEVHKLVHKVASVPRAIPLALNIPFGEVNPVIHRLNSQQSKGQQEGKSSEYIDEC
nr:hypothetical protein TorRG33x02_128480 [Ipomoea batatas]